VWRSSLLTFAGTCLLCRWSRTWLKAGWRVMTPAPPSWSHTLYNVSSLASFERHAGNGTMTWLMGRKITSTPKLTKTTLPTSLCHFCCWYEPLMEEKTLSYLLFIHVAWDISLGIQCFLYRWYLICLKGKWQWLVDQTHSLQSLDFIFIIEYGALVLGHKTKICPYQVNSCAFPQSFADVPINGSRMAKQDKALPSWLGSRPVNKGPFWDCSVPRFSSFMLLVVISLFKSAPSEVLRAVWLPKWAWHALWRKCTFDGFHSGMSSATGHEFSVKESRVFSGMPFSSNTHATKSAHEIPSQEFCRKLTLNFP
jgi:hypothetical protein